MTANKVCGLLGPKLSELKTALKKQTVVAYLI